MLSFNGNFFRRGPFEMGRAGDPRVLAHLLFGEPGGRFDRLIFVLRDIPPSRDRLLITKVLELLRPLPDSGGKPEPLVHPRLDLGVGRNDLSACTIEGGLDRRVGAKERRSDLLGDLVWLLAQ